MAACSLAGLPPALSFYPLGSGDDEMRTLKNSAMDEQLKGNADAALDLYQKLVDAAKQRYGANSSYVGDIYFDMGHIALQSTKFERAEAYLTEAVKIKPQSANARTKLAELLLLRGRPDEARDQAEKALQKHGNSLPARLILASALTAMGDTNRANRAFANLAMVQQGKKAPVPVAPPPPKPAPPPVVTPPAEPAPKPEEKKAKPPEPKAKAKPPEPKAKPKPPEPKAKAKPAEKKPEAKPTPKPAAKPQELKAQPLELKAVPAELKPLKPKMEPVPPPPPKSKPARLPGGGLVPPPPPLMPVFPGAMAPPPPVNMGGGPGYRSVLETQAKVKKEPKPKKHSEEEDSPKASGGGGGDDSDFLLDWANDGGKKKKGRKSQEE